MKNVALLALLLISNYARTQTLSPLLKHEIADLEKKINYKHATIAMTVIDNKSGKTIFQYNGEKGMSPASTQKIITSILAYETLGSDFRYRTDFSWNDNMQTLHIKSSGDPSLGSDRFYSTKSQRDSLVKILSKKAQACNNNFKAHIYSSYPIEEQTNEAWIWQDLGNYYGAAFMPLNWRENRFDMYLNSLYDTCFISSVSPTFLKDAIHIDNRCQPDSLLNSDNSLLMYNFTKPFHYLLSGSIPANRQDFKVSGSYNYSNYLFNEITDTFYDERNISFQKTQAYQNNEQNIFAAYSPSMDSLQFEFLHQSINLYGEALLKTIAATKYGEGSYANGIKAVHAYCKKIDLDTASVHIFDGSGLSPQNKVSSNALAKFLLTARAKSWFPNFFQALPIINNTHMKSGSIHQARAYVGYVDAKNGNSYSFAVIVNGYEGKGKPIQQNLWNLIDLLK